MYYSCQEDPLGIQEQYTLGDELDIQVCNKCCKIVLNIDRNKVEHFYYCDITLDFTWDDWTDVS